MKPNNLFMRIALLLLISTISLSTLSCNTNLNWDDNVDDPGQLVDKNMLDSIGEQFDSSPQDAHVVLEITGETYIFYTKNGSKFHINRECQALSQTDMSKIMYGQYKDHWKECPTEICSFCMRDYGATHIIFTYFETEGNASLGETPVESGGHSNTTPTTNGPSVNTSPEADNTSSLTPGITTEALYTTDFKITGQTVFYWTKSGSKLHIYRDCQSLANTAPENIFSGCYRNACEAKKTEPCAFCLKRHGIKAEDFPFTLPE